MLSVVSWSLGLNALLTLPSSDSSLPIALALVDEEPKNLVQSSPDLKPLYAGDVTQEETIAPSTPNFTLAQESQPNSSPENDTNEEQLFAPLHRKQPGQTPFVPTDLPLVSDTQDDRSAPNYVGTPASSIGVPGGTGATWRSFGVGMGIQSRARFTDRADGGLGIGLGFGTPNTIGLQVGLSFVDLSDPFADGSVSLKLHRPLPHNVSIALGATGVLTWGGPDGGSSIYGAVSKQFNLHKDVQRPFSQLTVTLGSGSGQFRSESQINADLEAVGVFGAVSLRVLEPVSTIVEWTGQDLNLGISVVPFRQIPLVVTPAVADVTGRAGDGPRFIVGIGYGTQF